MSDGRDRRRRSQSGVDGTATNVVGGGARRSQQKDFVFPLQKFEAELHSLDDSCFSDTAFASDGEKHLVVGLQGDFPMVSDGMAQDFPHRPKLFLVERQSLPDKFRDARSRGVGAQPGNAIENGGIRLRPHAVRYRMERSGLLEVSEGRCCPAPSSESSPSEGSSKSAATASDCPPTTYAATVAGCWGRCGGNLTTIQAAHYQATTL